MKKGKALRHRIKSLIKSNNPRYKITYTTITEDSYQVKITPLFQTCAICKKESRVDSMKYLHDNRVPLLFTGKWLDFKCWVQVDTIISNLKSSIPRNLSNLIAQCITASSYQNTTVHLYVNVEAGKSTMTIWNRKRLQYTMETIQCAYPSKRKRELGETNPVHALQGRSIRSAVLINNQGNNMNNQIDNNDIILGLMFLAIAWIMIIFLDVLASLA